MRKSSWIIQLFHGALAFPPSHVCQFSNQPRNFETNHRKLEPTTEKLKPTPIFFDSLKKVRCTPSSNPYAAYAFFFPIRDMFFFRSFRITKTRVPVRLVLGLLGLYTKEEVWKIMWVNPWKVTIRPKKERSKSAPPPPPPPLPTLCAFVFFLRPKKLGMAGMAGWQPCSTAHGCSSWLVQVCGQALGNVEVLDITFLTVMSVNFDLRLNLPALFGLLDLHQVPLGYAKKTRISSKDSKVNKKFDICIISACHHGRGWKFYFFVAMAFWALQKPKKSLQNLPAGPKKHGEIAEGVHEKLIRQASAKATDLLFSFLEG